MGATLSSVFSNNDKFGLSPSLIYKGKRKFSLWFSKLMTLVFFAYIIFSLTEEYKTAIDSPKYKLKDISSTAAQKSTLAFNYTTVPMIIRFVDDNLNDEWFKYFEIFMMHESFASNTFSPSFYPVIPCEDDKLPKDKGHITDEEILTSYCVPNVMSHQLVQGNSEEFSLFLSFCDSNNDPNCIDIQGNAAARQTFIEAYGVDQELDMNFLSKDIEFSSNDSHLKDIPYTLSLRFNIFSSLVTTTDIYFETLNFSKDKTFWKYFTNLKTEQLGFGIAATQEHVTSRLSRTAFSAFPQYLRDEVEYLAVLIHRVNLKYFNKQRNVTITYEDVFDLYLRILGSVAIPLLILSMIMNVIMNNLLLREMCQDLLGKKVKYRFYSFINAWDPLLVLSEEEANYVEAQTDILTVQKQGRGLSKLVTTILSKPQQKMLEIMKQPPPSLQEVVQKYDDLDNDPIFNQSFEQKLYRQRISENQEMQVNTLNTVEDVQKKMEDQKEMNNQVNDLATEVQQLNKEIITKNLNDSSVETEFFSFLEKNYGITTTYNNKKKVKETMQLLQNPK